MELENLEVYKRSFELACEIYDDVKGWKPLDIDTLGKQIIRAADSVASNIAEGYGRWSGLDNRRFCMYARGSLFEVRTQLELAKRRKLISDELYLNRRSSIDELIPKLIRYSLSIPLKTKV